MNVTHAGFPEFILFVFASGIAAALLVFRFVRFGTFSLRPTLRTLLPILLTFAGLLVATWGLSTFFKLATPFPRWIHLVLGTLLIELLLPAYRREMAEMSPKPARVALCLRCLTALLLFAMALQPVFVWMHDLRPERQIAVFLDESASMHMQDAGTDGTTSRHAAARSLLEANASDPGLLERLSENHGVRLFSMGGDTLPIPLPFTGASTQRVDEVTDSRLLITDMAASLRDVFQHIPENRLAGVVVLGDGRHNAPASIDEIGRELGSLGIPVSAVRFGSDRGVPDAAIFAVSAPDTLFLGDRLTIAADLRFHALRGRTVTVRCLAAGTEIDVREIRIPEDNHHESVRFSWRPEEAGIHDLSIVLDPVEGEFLDGNNSWPVHVAVSDDRTHVLLIDQRPRWEFRYLRNLFFGRDKSVHLQYVLFEPDHIEGQETPPRIPASAGREFGDAEATALPESIEEWNRFDLIILGDIAAAQLGEAEWKMIRSCVVERGAMLVISCGPHAMPTAHMTTPSVQELLPFREANGLRWNAESTFRVSLTESGKRHVIPRQAPDPETSADIWREAPPSVGRTVHTGLKEGVEVLMMASDPELNPDGSPSPNIADAVEALRNRRENEARDALLVTQSLGAGRVVTLLYDQTWRLRYGVGDTYHHRFWGQLTRWGAGPPMRAGDERTRLGTDRLVYSPMDPLTIHARVLDKDRMPIPDARPEATIWRDGKELTRISLAPSPASGQYQGTIPALADPGEYEIRLQGTRVPEDAPTTSFRVSGARDPRELADLSADLETFDRLARWTRGLHITPDKIDSLLEFLNKDSEPVMESRERPIWNRWPAVILFLGLLTAEWVLRRKQGLL